LGEKAALVSEEVKMSPGPRGVTGASRENGTEAQMMGQWAR
jgi:hypothetical protein